MRVVDRNWMQLEAYLESDDRIVLPLGSVEQHAYLSLGVDLILSQRVAEEAAEPLGVPVLPSLPYGITPYFGAYPGSPTVSAAVYGALQRDIAPLRSEPPAAVRELLGDGSLGGYYERPDEDVLRVWATGVDETRERLERGWRR